MASVPFVQKFLTTLAPKPPAPPLQAPTKFAPINPNFQPGGSAEPSTSTDSATSVPPPPASPTPQRAIATSARTREYEAAPYAVDPTTGTTQGQMVSLLDKGGAYLRRGATEGVQKAAERGLLNSSLSSGYAMGAMIDRALPIAQTDAGFFDKAMTNTANAMNAERQFNAQQANQIALENAKNKTQISALNAQEVNKLAGLELDADTRYALGVMDAQTRARLGVMDNDTKLLLQTNAAASDMYSNTIKNIADITRDPSINPDTKQAAVDGQLNMLNQGLKQLQSVSSAGAPENLALGDYFTKKTQIARMNEQQILDEKARLANAMNAAKAGTLARKTATDAFNEFNALVAEVRSAPNVSRLNLAEGF